MVVEILLVLSLAANAAMVFFLRRYIIRLLQFDELYQYLIDDVETNLKQFERIRKSSLMSDDDEVRNAHKAMMTMASRMDEFATQMEEIEGRPLRKVTKPMAVVNVTKAAEQLEINLG